MNRASTSGYGAGRANPADVPGESPPEDGIYQRIRRDVLNGSLSPSERLRLSAIAKRYASSVGSLREALSQLSSEGLIVFEPGRGFAVRPVSLEDLLDVSRMRIRLECEALAQAIQKGDEAWEAEIVRALHLLNATDQPGRRDPKEAERLWAERHQEFHRALLSACGSYWTMRFREILSDHAERYRRLSRATRVEPRDVAGEHRRIADAAVGRRSEEALAELALHFLRTAEVVAINVFGADAGSVRERMGPALPPGIDERTDRT